jgi:hypothetical protein
MGSGQSIFVTNQSSTVLPFSGGQTINGWPYLSGGNPAIWQGGFIGLTGNGTSADAYGWPGFGIISGDTSVTAAGVSTVANLSHVTNASLPNSGLVNSSMTICGTSISLGGLASPSCGGSSSVIYNSIGGCVLSNDGTTPNSVLDMAACQAADSTNATTITAASFKKSTAGAWASGTNSNGMGNGLTIAASTWYHVCLANNGGTADYWFDTSVTCANRPSGITDTKYRRIGSFKTDSSSHIITFFQRANGQFMWVNPVTDVTAASLATGSNLEALSVPPGVSVQAIVQGPTNFSGTDSVISLYDPAVTAANANNDYECISGSSGVCPVRQVGTNTSQQINVFVSLASVTGVNINTMGYFDPRGQ